MTLLNKAQRVVQERKQHYGNPLANFTEIAKRWSLTLKTSITPAQVALCMIDLKMSRLSHGPNHQDSLLDIVGYAACLSEIQQAQVKELQHQKGKKERAHAVVL